MSVVPTFWFGSRVAIALLSQPLDTERMHWRTLCLAARTCLSERDKELPDRDSSSLSINLRP